MVEGAVAVAGAKAHPSSGSSSMATDEVAAVGEVAAVDASNRVLDNRSRSRNLTLVAAPVGASNRFLDSRSRSRNLTLVAVPACRREAALRRALSGQQGGAAMSPHMAA
jgi:hypothetical protein